MQALLGERKVKFDPTKGSWKQHEYIAMKIIFAIQRVRVDVFMERFGADIILSAKEFHVRADVVLWKLQASYDDFL